MIVLPDETVPLTVRVSPGWSVGPAPAWCLTIFWDWNMSKYD